MLPAHQLSAISLLYIVQGQTWGMIDTPTYSGLDKVKIKSIPHSYAAQANLI